MSKPKIGSGHAQAMARLGLRELRNALNPSRESVADSEIGLYGSQTQGEIAQARGSFGHGPEQEGDQKQSGTLSLESLREQAAKEQSTSRQLGQEKDQPGRDLD
jgi:hypothetical protein